MKTAHVIKNIHKCQEHPKIEQKDDHRTFGLIFKKANNEKEAFLETGFQDEKESQDLALPPIEFIEPVF